MECELMQAGLIHPYRAAAALAPGMHHAAMAVDPGRVQACTMQPSP